MSIEDDDDERWQHQDGPAAIDRLVFARFDKLEADGFSKITTAHVRIGGEWHWGELPPDGVTGLVADLLGSSLDMENVELTTVLTVVNAYLLKVEPELAKRKAANR